MLESQPVRDWLRERSPVLPRKKLVDYLSLRPMGAVPKGVTEAQAVDVVQGTTWAQNLAAGICGKLVGMEAGTKRYEDCVSRVSRRVAEGLLE